MKKSYKNVSASHVIACKDVARALINLDFDFYSPPYDNIANYINVKAIVYENTVTKLLDCRDEEFREDFTEWLELEIFKIYKRRVNNKARPFT